MQKPTLTIFYQFNPWESSIGGIQTVIRSFLKYAPQEFEVRLVGTGKQSSSVGVWQQKEYAGRTIQFMPVIAVEDDNTRKIVPTTLKYTAALLGKNFASDFMHFHRLEPTLATLNWSGHKTLFIHNDIKQQLNPENSKNAILWKYFPAGYFALEGSLIKQFNQIYSCNTESAQFYREQYPAKAEQVTFLRNTVDNEIFYPLATEAEQAQRTELALKMGLSPQTRFLLFAGRLHPQKDPLLLVRSLAALQMSDVHLLIAGDGELAEDIKAEIDKCGVSEQVTMLGAVPHDELAKLQRLSSVFVLSSAYEGLPVVVLEALACGTPVVTTHCGETPKLLTSDSGVVSKARTPEAIAEALSQVLQQPEAFPTSACVRTAQPFGARHVVLNVYQQMLHQWEQRMFASTTLSTSKL